MQLSDAAKNNRTATRLPRKLVWSVIGLSLLPFLLNLLGLRFGFVGVAFDIATPTGELPSPLELIIQTNVAGGAVHTILEWTSFCVALFTVCFALAHFSITRDPTTPIIGTALFFSGMIDGFRILSADGLIATAFDQSDFIPFTWMISRSFNAALLVAGCLPFLFKHPILRHRQQERGLRFIILVGILFGLMAYAIIHICAVVPTLPKTVYPDKLIPRPWDIIPLVLYLVAGGIVIPRFYRLRPSLFSHALLLSLIPNVTAQAHAAFGSRILFDNDFNIALFLKVVAYSVPLAGLVLDYLRTYGTEVELRMVRQKLDVARDVQQRLLPRGAPKFPGFDIAGDLRALESAGGDYYDYIPMQGGFLGVVIADVSGHGIGAAMLMAVTRAYLRAEAAARLDLKEIATRVNRLLSDDLHNRWIVTMFFAKLDPESRTIEYAAAGHESYIIRSDDTLVTLRSTSPPLGVLDDGIIECGPAEQLQDGDVLLLLTDGLIEALSPQGEPFGLHRIRQTVIENREKTATEIMKSLQQAMLTHCGSGELHDDVTIVAIKATA